MAYAAKADMEARLKESDLLDLTNPNDLNATTIGDGVLQVALDDASAEIDILLSGRFATPVTNPPAVLTSLCCTIARYNLYSGKSTEEVETRYKNAVKLLKSIASGAVDLGTGTDVSSGPSFSKPESVFSTGMMGTGR